MEHRVPIVLEVTTTVDTGANVTLNAGELGLPLKLVVDIVPAGGVVTLELDGDLVLTWDDSDVSAGQTFDLVATLAQSDSDTIGAVGTSLAYLVQPGFEIDFDAAFDPTEDWVVSAPDLQSYLITGARGGGIGTGTVGVPQVVIEERDVLVAAADELFLLADTYVFSHERVDTLALNYTLEPYPCVRVSASGDLFTYLEYDVGILDLCARYAPPSDSLCWTSTEPLTCMTQASEQITFANVPVGCEAVRDLVVPICPIKASGTANISVRTELVLDDLQLHYTCDPPGPLGKGDLPPFTNTVPVVTDSTWLVATDLSIETDRDDAIFTVPVLLDSVALTVSEGGVPLDPDDIVNDGDDYSIDWTALDEALRQCCAGPEEVKLVYRAVDDADPVTACSEEIAVVTDAGTFAWSPAVGCAPQGVQKFVAMIEFSCPDTEAILYRARSDTLRYSK